MDNGAWEGEKAMSPKVNWVRGRTLEGGEKLDVPQSTQKRLLVIMDTWESEWDFWKELK